MKKLLLLILSFLPLLADNDVFNIDKNTFSIYIYGNVVPYYQIFQYIAMLSKDGTINYILILGITIISFFMARKAFQGDLAGIGKQTVWTLAVATFLFVPTSTVLLIDKRIDYGIISYNNDNLAKYGITYSSAAKVDHIPLAIAAGTSAASIITSLITEKIDEAMSPVDDTNYHYAQFSSVGFGTPLEDLLISAKVGDLYKLAMDGSIPEDTQKISRETITYIGECLIKYLPSKPSAIKYLINPNEDYKDALNYENFELSGDEKVTFDGNETTCKDLYDEISDSTNLDKVQKVLLFQIKGLTHPYDEDNTTFSNYVNGVYKSIIDPYSLSALGDFKQASYNLAIGLVIPKLFQKYGIGLNGIQLTQGVAAEKSKMNMLNEGLGSFNWMMSIIPKAMNILFAILIALYLPMAIVVVLAGMERGSKILMNYFFGLVSFKSIDIGLAVVNNIANYYGASSLGEKYYSLGKNLYSTMNIPYLVGDLANSAGLAGLLGIAAVFLTPVVVFFGESKAATSILQGIKGAYAGFNPDLAAGNVNAVQGNLEYQAEKEKLAKQLKEEGYSDDNINYYLKKLGFGFDSAETAKYYNQMQSEINAINQGAAFASVAATNNMDNYGLGSYANSVSNDFKTVGAGVAVSTQGATSIQSIQKGSLAMGAKSMAQVIGYGSTVNLEDASIAGLSSGLAQATQDNITGEKLSNLTNLDNYLRGIESNKAKELGTIIGTGKTTNADKAFDAGIKQGDTIGSEINATYKHLTENEARALGTEAGLKKHFHGKSLLKSGVLNSDGSDLNNNKLFKDDLLKQQKDLIKQRDKEVSGYRLMAQALRNAGDVEIADGLEKRANEIESKYNKKIDDIEKLIDKSGNKTIGEAWAEGMIKSSVKDISKSVAYGGVGSIENSQFAGFAEGLKQAASDEGIKNAIENDKNGFGDYYKGVERETRASINKTIGTGELVFTDKNKHKISEQKAMGFIKAGAAKGFAAQIFAGEADSEKAFGGQGEHGEKILKADIAKGLYRSEEANLGNIAGMAEVKGKNGKKVDDNEFYKNIKASSIEKGTQGQIHAERMREAYGDNLDRNFRGRTFADRVSDIERKNINSFAGVADADSKHSDNEFYSNANYGEDSKISTTQAKIRKLGGVDKAVAFDASNATTKITKDKAALEGEVSKALEKAGYSEEQANKLAKAIVEGSKLGSEEFKKALEQIGSKANTLTKAKEGGEYSKMDEYKSSNEFIKAQEYAAAQQEVKGTKRLFESLNNEQLLQNRVDGLVKAASMVGNSDEERRKNKEAMEDYLIKNKMAVRDETGRLKALNNPEAWIDGLAIATNSTTDRLFVGGMRIDQKYNPLTGEVLTNADKTQSYSDGTRISTGDRVDTESGALQRIISDIKKEHPNWSNEQVLNEARKRVAQYEKNKSYLNAKDDLAINAPEIVNQAIGLLSTYGLVAGGVGAIGGVVEKVTAKGVKLNPEKLKEQGAVFKEANPEKGITGGWYKDGRKIADTEGYLLDEKGERVKKGLVSKGFDYAKELKDNLMKKGESFSSGSSSDRFNESDNQTFSKTNDRSKGDKETKTYENNRNTDNHTKQEKTNSHSKTPFDKIVNDNDIVNDNKNPVNNLDNIAHYEEMEKKQLFEEVSKKRPRKPERIEAKNEILKALKNDEPINKEWLKELGYSNKDINNRFGHIAKDFSAVDNILYEVKSFGKDIANKATDVFEDAKYKVTHPIETLGDIADGVKDGAKYVFNHPLEVAKTLGKVASILIEGTPFAPTVMADDDEMLKKYYESHKHLRNISNEVSDQNISTSVANILGQNQPIEPSDYHTAVSNQIMQAMQTYNMAQAIDAMKEITNPVAPVYGVTIPTMGGNLSITQSQNGYLQIGDYTTNVPMQEFRQYMNTHPQAMQEFSNILASSKLNNENTYLKFGEGYQKLDTGNLENLLSELRNLQFTVSKDNVVGIGTMMDYQEAMVEKLEELKENKEEK